MSWHVHMVLLNFVSSYLYHKSLMDLHYVFIRLFRVAERTKGQDMGQIDL